MIKLSDWLGEGFDQLNNLESFEKLYNKYVRYYNKNHLRALADFGTILSSLDKRYDEKEDQLDYTVEVFKHNISILSFKDAKSGIPENLSNNTIEVLDWEKELFDLVDELFSTAWINSSLLREPNDDNLDEIYNFLSKIYESVNSEPYQAEGMDYINMACGAYNDLKKIDVNKRVLKFINDKILDNGYPDQLKLLGEMTETEQEEVIKGIENKGGRPPDFDINDTEKWFKELRQKPEYQRSNDRPNITKITLEIQNRHESKTGERPSESTIKNHRRELGLMQNGS